MRSKCCARAACVRASTFCCSRPGFEISEGWLDFDAGQPFWRAFLAGLINTVRAAVPAAVMAVLLGTLLGIGRLAPHVLVRGLCGAYVETLRNVPLLVQLLMLYFALTQLLPDSTEPLELLPGVWLSKGGLSMPWPVREEGALWPSHFEWPERGSFNVSGGAALSPEYLAVVIALALYTAAFVAEIVRAGITSVSQGQKLAAQALGPVAGAATAHRGAAAGAARDRAGADQPVAEPDQELVAGGGGGLSGTGVDRQHLAQLDRPRLRVHCRDHGRVPRAVAAHLGRP